jgi:hypothetical protein
MPILREDPDVTILGVRSVFVATEDTRVAALEYGEEGIKGVSWRRASALDPRPPSPPAVKVEAVILAFNGIRVETADPAILENLHDPEWRKAFVALETGNLSVDSADVVALKEQLSDPEDTAA